MRAAPRKVFVLGVLFLVAFLVVITTLETQTGCFYLCDVFSGYDISETIIKNDEAREQQMIQIQANDADGVQSRVQTGTGEDSAS